MFLKINLLTVWMGVDQAGVEGVCPPRRGAVGSRSAPRRRAPGPPGTGSRLNDKWFVMVRTVKLYIDELKSSTK